MKITFFVGSLIGGGAERVVCNMANYFVQRNHRVDILTMSETESYPLDSRVETIALLKRSENKNAVRVFFRRISRLKNYIRKSDCDIYIVMLPITTIVLLMLKRFTKVPIIASERSFPPNNPKVIQFLLKLLAKNAKGWVFQTTGAKDWYAPYCRNSFLTIIPNAINDSLPEYSEEVKRDKIIVSVGRLTRAKRFDLLISAFSKIAAKCLEYKLIIYGEGSERDMMEKLIKELNLEERVFLPGFNKVINNTIQHASLFVLSSDFEGMPNALIESMAMGIPCVATDCDGGSARYLIDDGKNGFLVPKGDVDALSEKMLMILSNESLAMTMGREAAKIRMMLSPEVIYDKWERFIDTILHV